MKKILFLLLLLPVFAFGQSTGKIMSNRSSSATLPVDSINCNSKINLNQTTASVTLTLPNRTTTVACGSVTSGVTMYLSNVGSVTVTVAVTGHSNLSIAVNEQAILNWVGTKWIVLYIGSTGGSFLPLAGGTVQDSVGVNSISTTLRTLSYNADIRIDWRQSRLQYAGLLSIDWGSRICNDFNGPRSIDWDRRILQDSNGGVNINISLNWNKRKLTGVWSTTDTFKIGNNANAFVGKIYTNSLSANRNYNLPNNSGTLAVTGNNISVFAATTSAQLAGVLTDESGTGVVAYTTSPVFTTPNIGTATGNITGNANTATALQTPRNINGQPFDGTADITTPTSGNYTAQSTTYSIAATDYLINCTSGTFTATLPTAVGVKGRLYIVKNSGSGTITVATTSSQTIDASTTKTLSVQYGGIEVMSTGANWIVTRTF